MFTRRPRPLDTADLQPTDVWIEAFSQDGVEKGPKKSVRWKPRFCISVFFLDPSVPASTKRAALPVPCPFLQAGPKDPPQHNPTRLKFYKIPTALQLPSLACQDSSISNSVSWCLERCQGPAFAPNDSQLRGHWEGLNSICRPSNLIRGAGFLFSPKFAVAWMNDGQRMSCQHQQRLGDKRKKMRGYEKNFFFIFLEEKWVCSDWQHRELLSELFRWQCCVCRVSLCVGC